jgi:hypothetical protein
LVQIKQSALALGQGGLDRNTLGVQPVQIAIERIFSQSLKIDLQNVR